MLIKEEGTSCGQWKLAKIASLNYSKDKEVRSAHVLLPGQMTLSRPLNLLFPLEITHDRGEKVESSSPEPIPPDKGDTNQKDELPILIRPMRKAAQAFRDHMDQLIHENALATFSLGNVATLAVKCRSACCDISM